MNQKFQNSLWTLGQKSSTYPNNPKNHILKISLFTKFIIPKSHFHKIQILKISFFTKFTFFKHQFLRNFRIKSAFLPQRGKILQHYPSPKMAYSLAVMQWSSFFTERKKCTSSPLLLESDKKRKLGPILINPPSYIHKQVGIPTKARAGFYLKGWFL